MTAFLPQEAIRAKRDGRPLPAADIRAFVAGLTDGSVTEGQVAALAMAVFFRGMEPAETVALTLAMRDSGKVLDWSTPGGGPVLDKHSTGGVGDNVSLMLAPILAACGARVPMISGRGLGHTGGTLDKLDAIPGYTSQPDEALFRRCVAEAGCAIIGQTGELAPADRRFYAIRDVTATVESVPLITASILSKKLAAGLGSLVLDVKVGSGAFMADLASARILASSLVTVANDAGLPTTALLTDMDEPLARAAGNAVEVLNAIRYLTGERRDPRLHAVTMALAGEMLALGGLAAGAAAGRAAAEAALADGRAAEGFARMVAVLGGPSDFLDRPQRHLPVAPVIRPVFAAGEGRVAAIDTRALGVAVVALGGGRRRAEDRIDPAVGLTELAGIGETVGEDARPLALVHARDDASLDAAAAAVRAAYRIGAGVAQRRTVIERVAPDPSASAGS